ncbi:hypothetical protein QBL02_08485 [Leucobacter sp. UT-8R-CII-1-4]|uniref:hypothetical protein n=1 Tax=Leucobacter sp. UT-8R-CII-1-4 TaxID=3040075 RepID=UPI0024A886D3|nr:hypothetical protein [Leucobacter sp. UT-8R-CII-1-4]MDI6023580.1 hypothetical protein [Leucobacter sp. UT-8R-CII-1-4]
MADSQNWRALLGFIRDYVPRETLEHSCSSIVPGYEVSTERKQTQHRLSALEIKEIIRQFREGKTTLALADASGCSRTTISRHLQNAGLSAREKRFDEAQLREMERLYETGLSLDKVGERFGTTGTTATKYLRACGVQIRDRHDWLR